VEKICKQIQVARMDKTTKQLESYTSADMMKGAAITPAWVKLGAVAVASAIAGGVAAAWWYRKTLTRLHQAAEDAQNTEFSMADQRPVDES